MSIPSELGRLISLTNGKTRWRKRVSNPETLDPESYALPLRHNAGQFLGTLLKIPRRLFNLHLSDSCELNCTWQVIYSTADHVMNWNIKLMNIRLRNFKNNENH